MNPELRFSKMPIKPITSDGNGFLRKFVSEIEELERKRHHLALTKIPPGMRIPEEIQATSQQIASVKLAIKGLLADETLWRESEKFPAMISDIHTSSNGDWNGNQIGCSTVVKIRGKLILFKNALFDVTGLYTKEEAKLLVVKNYEAERSDIDFLKSRSDESPSKSKTGREPIPERIRNEVWRRDSGKCVECGSVYNLEFDHVIPVAKGGSNTARNLRILCEPCNRRKSDSIG